MCVLTLRKDHVDISEEHWFYELVCCTSKRCSALVGLLNKFKNISISHIGCIDCYSQICFYTPDMMPTELVTVLVRIYDRAYNVRYPSEQRVMDLMVEFAMQCKGLKKPTGGLKYFICIHCGKSTFFNR